MWEAHWGKLFIIMKEEMALTKKVKIQLISRVVPIFHFKLLVEQVQDPKYAIASSSDFFMNTKKIS